MSSKLPFKSYIIIVCIYVLHVNLKSRKNMFKPVTKHNVQSSYGLEDIVKISDP